MFLILLHLPPHLFVSDCFCVLLWTGHTGTMAPQATGLILPSNRRTVYAKPGLLGSEVDDQYSINMSKKASPSVVQHLAERWR